MDAVLVLLIDDDAELCGLVSDFLGARGYSVTAFQNGTDGLRAALLQRFHLVLLDVMLPAVDGFEVLAQLRTKVDTPVIMLTARVEDKDRIKGLDGGADDYLPKPFNPEELVARMRAVLRRTDRKHREQRTLEIGVVKLDLASRRAQLDDRDLGLTQLEFDILAVLMRAAGRIVSRDELSAALHQRQPDPFDRAMDVHVSHIRQKMAEKGHRLIRTVRGSGFLYVGGAQE